MPHSNALHSMLRGHGPYLVGPLARYNLNFDHLAPLAREAALEFFVTPGLDVRLLESEINLRTAYAEAALAGEACTMIRRTGPSLHLSWTEATEACARLGLGDGEVAHVRQPRLAGVDRGVERGLQE